MPNEIVDEIRSVVSEIKNQLKFYQDIGLEDIGAALGSEGAPRAASKPPITLPSAEATEPSFRHVRMDEADIPSEPFVSKQSSAPDATVGLFGESLIEPSHKAVTRRAAKLIFAPPVAILTGGLLFGLLLPVSIGGAMGAAILCALACGTGVAAGTGACRLVDRSARAMFLRERGGGLPPARLLSSPRHR